MGDLTIMVDVRLILYSPPTAMDCTAPSNINWSRQQSPATEIIETALRNIYKIDENGLDTCRCKNTTFKLVWNILSTQLA